MTAEGFTHREDRSSLRALPKTGQGEIPRNGKERPGNEPTPETLHEIENEILPELLLPYRPGESGLSPTDPLEIYLQEIGERELLKPHEEISLAKMIDRGIRAAKKNGVSPAREREIAEGKNARRALTEANLRLVVSVALKYVGRGVQLLDLIQEGNLGLMKAVEKFDYRRGYKFSTYGVWWIRQAVARAVDDQASDIRIPVATHLVKRKIKNVLNVAPPGKKMTAKEVAKETGLPLGTILFVRKHGYISEQSLQAPIRNIHGKDDSTLTDMVPDERALLPERASDVSDDVRTMQDILRIMPENASQAWDFHAGISGIEADNRVETGKWMGFNRERIRQFEGEGLAVLFRNPEVLFPLTQEFPASSDLHGYIHLMHNMTTWTDAVHAMLIKTRTRELSYEDAAAAVTGNLFPGNTQEEKDRLHDRCTKALSLLTGQGQELSPGAVLLLASFLAPHGYIPAHADLLENPYTELPLFLALADAHVTEEQASWEAQDEAVCFYRKTVHPDISLFTPWAEQTVDYLDHFPRLFTIMPKSDKELIKTFSAIVHDAYGKKRVRKKQPASLPEKLSQYFHNEEAAAAFARLHHVLSVPMPERFANPAADFWRLRSNIERAQKELKIAGDPPKRNRNRKNTRNNAGL